jgi:rhodanese-related sulfurtransferase
MTSISESKIRLGALVGCLFFGILLAIIGVASGNAPLIHPGLNGARADVKQDGISNEQLAEWILSGREDFYLVGFHEAETSRLTQQPSPIFKYYELNDLKNPFWLRRFFPNLRVPLVVYGEDGSKSLEVAAWLKHYGYKVHHLEGGYRDFANQYIQPVDTTTATSPEKLKELQQKQLLYWYFSGNDPNIAAQSYGNSSLIRKGSILRDEVGENPPQDDSSNKPVVSIKSPVESNSAEEGC